MRRMPQVLRPKKVVEDLPVSADKIVSTSETVDISKTENVNIRDYILSSNPGNKNVDNSISASSNLPTDNIVNKTPPLVEVHDEPTHPEISDALQKLLEMKVSKTLATAKASLEEKEPVVLNKVVEAVLVKPNLGKEIRVPKPVEVVVSVPVMNNQIANTVAVSTPPVISPVTPVTTVTPVVATTNAVQPSNSQSVATAVPSIQEVPKKSFLDKLLGFE